MSGIIVQTRSQYQYKDALGKQKCSQFSSFVPYCPRPLVISMISRVFISLQNLGCFGNNKIINCLGFQKSILYQCFIFVVEMILGAQRSFQHNKSIGKLQSHFSYFGSKQTLFLVPWKSGHAHDRKDHTCSSNITLTHCRKI